MSRSGELSARMPERRGSLVRGDLSALPQGTRYGVVIGIQVFQHGHAEAAHAHLAAARARVAPGGLMAVRVNAAGTDIAFAHRVTGRNDDGVTIRYLEGPKAGLEVHFFGEAELRGLFATGFEPVLPPRPRSPGDSLPRPASGPSGKASGVRPATRQATLRVNIPCATPADLATMSGATAGQNEPRAARPEGGDRDLDG